MLGTFSFELWLKNYPCFTFWSLEFSDIAIRPPFSFLPAPLLPAPPTAPRRPPPRWVTPGQVRLRLRFTWRPHALLDPAPRALELPPFATPPPKLRAAATPTPPWRARCSTKDPQFARASEPRAPHPSFPPLICPLAALEPAEHRRRPA